MDDLNEILAFTRVVERKGFSAAAKELDLSPSVVSKRVTALEARLGVQLLNRSTRRLSLTEAGSQFYRRCAKALSDLAQASGEAAGYADKVAGQIRVHATLGVGLRAVVSGIISFTERYPQLTVEFTVGSGPFNLIEQGVDLLIRSADINDASIESRVLLPVGYHVVATPEYFRRHGRPSTPADLAAHNCLIHAGQRVPYEWTFEGPDGRYAVKISGTFATNSGAALHEAVLRGLGVGRLPDYTVREDLAAGRLESALDGQLASDRCIRAYYPRTRYPQPKVTLLVEHLEAYLRGAPALAAAANG